MQYWLLKSEPDTFSWQDLINKGIAMWDGVRNYQARNFLRQMHCGDWAFFYQSVKNPAIVGIVEITKAHYPDPTAGEGNWSAVDVQPVRATTRAISLNEIKTVPELQNMILLKNSRLSVQPVSKSEFEKILELEKLKA